MNGETGVRPVVVFFAVIQCLTVACTPVTTGHPPKPPLPTERIPLPPAADESVTWQPGHYDWTGTAYVWVPGEWVRSAGHGIVWQDGQWRGEGRNWVWVPAHWI